MNTLSNKARHYGPKAIEISKIFFVLAFVILAMTNRDQRYLKKQPIRTTFEILFAGLGGAVSFMYVARSRGVTDPQLSMLVAGSFVVFGTLQLLFELAGFNEVKVAESNKGAKKFEEQTKKATNSLAFKILVGIAIISGILLCFVAKDSPFTQITPVQFGYEALAMGLGAAIPTIMVTLDRGGSARNVLINFFAQFFMFGVVAHPFLQYSGMYRHLFTASPRNV
jgi:hypothetical protein